jgi:hypothetical protein
MCDRRQHLLKGGIVGWGRGLALTLEMKPLLSQVVRSLRPEFDRLLMEDPETCRISLYDNELNDLASCCTQGEVACFYLLDYVLHGGDGQIVAGRLVEDVAARQLTEGGFGQPYYVKRGELPKVDIAEIGAVANSLYHLHVHLGSEPARQSLVKAADYLLTQVARENPGAIYKNPDATNEDVLNGDIYAAHTLCRAYEVTKRPIYLNQCVKIIEHVLDRFGRHTPGWWPYTEKWDGTIGLGNSVSYQATIVAFAHTCIPFLPASLRQQWQEVSHEATTAVLQALKGTPNDDVEAPWWARDWDYKWEIFLALWRQRSRQEARDIVMNRFRNVATEVTEQGIHYFRPEFQRTDADRSPVTTMFRRAATFAGIVSYMWFDE